MSEEKQTKELDKIWKIQQGNTEVHMEIIERIEELEDRLQKCGIQWDFRLDELSGFIKEIAELNSLRYELEFWKNRVSELEKKANAKYVTLYDSEIFNNKIAELKQNQIHFPTLAQKIDSLFNINKLWYKTADMESMLKDDHTELVRLDERLKILYLLTEHEAEWRELEGSEGKKDDD